MLKAKDTHSVLTSTRAYRSRKWYWKTIGNTFWCCKWNATCVGNNTFFVSRVSWNHFQWHFIEKQHYGNQTAPKIWYRWTQHCHAKQWWEIVGVVCMFAWHVAFRVFRAFSSLTMDTSDIRCCTHFPFIPMGMLRFDCSGHFPFIAVGMLDIRCSGHLFFSFKQACCVLVVLGIFSFSFKWACCVLVVLGFFSFMKLGMLFLGISGHVSSHANGHVALGSQTSRDDLWWNFSIKHFECLVGDLAMSAGFLPQPSDCFTESQTQYILIWHGTWHSMHGHPTAILPIRILRLRGPIKPGVFSWKLPPWKVTVPDPSAQELDLLSLGGGRPVNFRCLKAGGFLKQELSTDFAVDFAVDFLGRKIQRKNPPKKSAGKSAGWNRKICRGWTPPWDPLTEPPPPPPITPPPSPRESDSKSWLVRSTSACGGSHLVAQPVSGGLHSFLGAGAQRGANAALAGTGHGFSEMHALSILVLKFGLWILKKNPPWDSARPGKTNVAYWLLWPCCPFINIPDCDTPTAQNHILAKRPGTPLWGAKISKFQKRSRKMQKPKNSEKFKNFQKISEIFKKSENFLKISEVFRKFQKISENFQDLSRTVPDLSRTCPGPVPDLSRTCPDLSRTCPGPVPDLSRTCPGQCLYGFSEIFEIFWNFLKFFEFFWIFRFLHFSVAFRKFVFILAPHNGVPGHLAKIWFWAVGVSWVAFIPLIDGNHFLFKFFPTWFWFGGKRLEPFMKHRLRPAMTS